MCFSTCFIGMHAGLAYIQVIYSNPNMLLDLRKPALMAQELKFNLQPNINDTLNECTVQKHQLCSYSQVCFHRRLFANPVKLHWCIAGLVGPLGSANQSWCGVKLLTMSVSTHSVGCVHICHLLRGQHHCQCPNGNENPASACPPTPTRSPPIHDMCDITIVAKNP